MRCFRMMLSLFLAFLFAATLSAAEWGDLTGVFKLDGAIPASVPIKVTKDQAFCGKFNLVDEGLVVSKDGGIANVVVYIYLKRGAKKPAVHADYAKTAKDKIKLDNDKCRFEPRVVLLRTTQTLVVGNKDAVGHNTKIDTFSNPPINPIIPAGTELTQNFTNAEKSPRQASCSIHPWMNSWLLIKDNPYMAVTDKDGKFTIKNLPAGKWTFQFWQENSGYVSEVKVKGKKTSWKRGRVEIDIKPGKNDLGDILVSSKEFAK